MNIKKTITSFAAIAMLLIPMSSSFAIDKTAAVALTSNYIFRGESQSNDSAAVQASYDMSLEESKKGGGYVGTFASTVGQGLEFDFYAGRRGTFEKGNKVGYDIGLVKYTYLIEGYSPDINEFYIGVNYETAYVKMFNGNFFEKDEYSYLDIGATLIVLDDVDLDLHYGMMLDTASNSDMSAALRLEIKGFDLNLGLAYGSASGDGITFLATVGKAFDLGKK